MYDLLFTPLELSVAAKEDWMYSSCVHNKCKFGHVFALENMLIAVSYTYAFFYSATALQGNKGSRYYKKNRYTYNKTIWFINSLFQFGKI